LDVDCRGLCMPRKTRPKARRPWSLLRGRPAGRGRRSVCRRFGLRGRALAGRWHRPLSLRRSPEARRGRSSPLVALVLAPGHAHIALVPRTVAGPGQVFPHAIAAPGIGAVSAPTVAAPTVVTAPGSPIAAIEPHAVIPSAGSPVAAAPWSPVAAAPRAAVAAAPRSPVAAAPGAPVAAPAAAPGCPVVAAAAPRAPVTSAPGRPVVASAAPGTPVVSTPGAPAVRVDLSADKYCCRQTGGQQGSFDLHLAVSSLW